MQPALRYAQAMLLVAAGTVLAYIGQASGVQSQTLALAYVVPVAVAAAYLGWGPAIATVAVSVAAFDFLFTQPIYTLNVASRSDIAAMVLLAVVAAVVSTVAAEARRRTADAQAAADRAEALRQLAHATLRGEADAALFKVAAETLARVFKAPAVIYTEDNGVLSTVASAGGARISASDREAAQWAASHETPVQGHAYPFDHASFDMWPVETPAHRRLILGVSFGESELGRPGEPGELFELVAGYLAAGLARASPA